MDKKEYLSSFSRNNWGDLSNNLHGLTK